MPQNSGLNRPAPLARRRAVRPEALDASIHFNQPWSSITKCLNYSRQEGADVMS
jgi:hypothetical protein